MCVKVIVLYQQTMECVQLIGVVQNDTQYHPRLMPFDQQHLWLLCLDKYRHPWTSYECLLFKFLIPCMQTINQGHAWIATFYLGLRWLGVSLIFYSTLETMRSFIIQISYKASRNKFRLGMKHKGACEISHSRLERINKHNETMLALNVLTQWVSPQASAMSLPFTSTRSWLRLYTLSPNIKHLYDVIYRLDYGIHCWKLIPMYPQNRLHPCPFRGHSYTHRNDLSTSISTLSHSFKFIAFCLGTLVNGNDGAMMHSTCNHINSWQDCPHVI